MPIRPRSWFPIRRTRARAEAPGPDRRLARRVRLGLAGVGWAAVVAFVLIAGLRLSGLSVWPIELAYHFLPFYAMGALALTVLFALLRRAPGAAASLVLAGHFAAVAWLPGAADCYSLGPLRGASAAETAQATPTRPFSLVTYNIHAGNRPSRWMRKWMEKPPADFLMLQEVSAPIARAVRGLDGVYPERLIAEGSLADQGIALLSSRPLAEHRVFQPIEGVGPAIFARLTHADPPAPWLVTVHAPNPVRAEGLRQRDRFLAALAHEIRRLDGPVVVAGDFNATPFTPAFAGFVETAGLRTTCRHPGTFPSSARFLGLPIDHVLVRDADIAGVWGFRPLGSDHRALGATVLLP
jgi:endonuclease/exonuclease/phosphatase (EEP) superfamily protein YafD